jgi:hypothetical protein
MKRLSVIASFLLTLLLTSCVRDVDEGKTNAQMLAATATTQANLAALPTDVPMRADATNLKFAAANTYISYEVAGTVEEVVAYYRDSLEALEWKKQSKSAEQPIGGAVTLLRSKPDKSISVTVQAIPGSESVRVLISILVK